MRTLVTEGGNEEESGDADSVYLCPRWGFIRRLMDFGFHSYFMF